jgi:hypothetical protein
MKTVIRLVSLFTALGLIGVLLSGCEDTDVTVPSSGAINMNAAPGAIQIDPNSDEPNPDTLRFEKDSTITATVFNERNLPVKGVTVDFEASSGIPMSPLTGQTDANGRIQSTLTVSDLDQGTVSVTARSGVVTGVVSLDVSVVGANQLPRAALVIIPGQQGQVGDIITFDGSGSLDPDSNITCYQWEFDSDNPDDPANDPELVQGKAASGVNRTYVNEQTVAVTLRVSDNPDAAACDDVDAQHPGGILEPASFFSPLAALTQYPVLCNNPPPTAVISGPPIITATGNPSTLTSVTLNGTLSFDGETPIDRYVWNCGNEFAATPVQPGDNSVVICRYRLGTYTATLNVTDQGTGQINPGTGTFDCQKTSNAASVSVVVATP